MKRHSVLSPLVLVSLLFLLNFSCRKKEPCNVLVQDSYFTFRLVDRYGVNQIAKWGARYLSDSVYVTKNDGNLPNSLAIDGGGEIGFFIPDSFDEAVDSFVSRQFLLYLPDVHGHPKVDVDTISFKYHFEKVGEFTCFERLQVAFNDSLYHDGQYIDFMAFTKK